MSYSQFASKLVEFAKSEKSIEKVKLEIERIRTRTTDPQEFLLTMGYAAHYADNDDTQHVLSRICHAVGIDRISRNAEEVYINADNCAIPRLKPHVIKMVKESETVDTLVHDVMNAVRYSKTSHEQSLILRLVEGQTRDLAASNTLGR